jgi:N-acetylglutamate synthase-like GNAT family acetyltransferase
MPSTLPQNTNIVIRPFQYRDLEEVERLSGGHEVEERSDPLRVERRFQLLRRWQGWLKSLSSLPNPLRRPPILYVAEQNSQIYGMIQVAPFNRTRSTWRVDQVAMDIAIPERGDRAFPSDVGSQLLRHCFQTIWEARTWLTEVDINDKTTLALYRQNGFQPLAQVTYWAIAPDLLKTLAEREPDLPNLLPVSHADASLLYQLDTASMPPLVRQVFDRHILDFKSSLFSAVMSGFKQWFNHTEMVSHYVFEPQRKAAIGCFTLHLSRDGSQPHLAELTVHPAYTWLYPELMSQMAQIAQSFPAQSLRLASSDYHPEREEYLEQIGASRMEHTLMMSRSVWHKLRESKPVSLEGLQLSDVLQGFQPARKPIPSRLSWLEVLQPSNHAADVPPVSPGETNHPS